jgi:hypothetical protein
MLDTAGGNRLEKVLSTMARRNVNSPFTPELAHAEQDKNGKGSDDTYSGTWPGSFGNTTTI